MKYYLHTLVRLMTVVIAAYELQFRWPIIMVIAQDTESPLKLMSVLLMCRGV